MIERLSIALLFALLVFSCAEPIPQETASVNDFNTITYFVRGGEALAVEEDYDKWSREARGLSGEKANNMLYASKMAAGDRYIVKANLTLSKTESGPSPTALIEIGGHHISMKRNDSSAVVTITGPFVNTYEESFYDEKPFELNTPFECIIDIEKETLALSINRKPIHKENLIEPITGKLGVYPSQGRVTVHEFMLQGKAVPIPQPKHFVRVFERGEAGYNTIRIPVIVRTNDGTLLAFGDGRKEARGDFGNIDLVMKRSEDGGATWGELQVIIDDGGDQEIEISAPCAAVDPETGVVHVVVSRRQKELIHITSNDDGETWSAPASITGREENKMWPGFNTKTSVGHFIHLNRGQYAGRLLVPVWLRDTSAIGYDSLLAITIYSDDEGKTWQKGEIVDAELWGSNEASLVELSDGRVLINMRVQDKTVGKRALAYSSDGGVTWTKSAFHDDLPDPVCHAAMLEANPLSVDDHCILFTNPFNPMYKNRSNLTLRVSCDEGVTWPIAHVIHEGPAAYSDMVNLPDNKVGVLFEYGHLFTYQAIVFETLDLDEVLD